MKSKINKLGKLILASSFTALSLALLQTMLVPPNIACLSAETNTVDLIKGANVSDEQLIRKEADNFVKAFATGDAETIANMCADECSLTDAEGTQFNGRAEIKKMYERDFQTLGLQPLSLKITKISFPAADVGIEDGEATFPRTASKTRYSVIHIKKDNTWKMLRISETYYNPQPSEALQSLSWMIGDWTLHGKNNDTFLKAYATNDGNFMVLQFSDREGTNIRPNALQVIGWSAKSKDIVSWNFGHAGGFGFGRWRKNDDNWFIETRGTTIDGSETVADYIIKHPDIDHFNWQSVGRAINGAKLPNMENVEATRHPVISK
ncbi:MAG: nuclear transport factor 2 family protein [Candidatus Obscuribacterales bacterium]|nr:nuclear transport factor 2 family protein [Candidatus Obscuribacterales bacterium]